MDDDEYDPYYDYDDEPEDCDHSEYEINIVDGRAECICGKSWWATTAQIDAEIQRHADYYEWCRRQESPWYRFIDWFKSLRPTFRWPRRRRRAPVDLDDEIPF